MNKRPPLVFLDKGSGGHVVHYAKQRKVTWSDDQETWEWLPFCGARADVTAIEKDWRHDQTVTCGRCIRSARVLRWETSGSTWQRSALDPQTGISFVISLVDRPFPQDGHEVEIEVDDLGRLKIEYVHRIDTALALCNKVVADRLSGADR